MNVPERQRGELKVKVFAARSRVLLPATQAIYFPWLIMTTAWGQNHYIIASPAGYDEYFSRCWGFVTLRFAFGGTRVNGAWSEINKASRWRRCAVRAHKRGRDKNLNAKKRHESNNTQGRSPSPSTKWAWDACLKSTGPLDAKASAAATTLLRFPPSAPPDNDTSLHGWMSEHFKSSWKYMKALFSSLTCDLTQYQVLLWTLHLLFLVFLFMVQLRLLFVVCFNWSSMS